MHFEWDRLKADRNRRKHRVTFDEAVTIFHDSLSATFDDPKQITGERRLISVGYSSRGRLLVVSHVERGETIRIISARLATAHERRRHES
jgi:uncharacterized DUF497 family protein